MTPISWGGIVRCGYFRFVLTVLLITFLNHGFARAAEVVPPPVAGPDVIDNFTTSRTFSDGLSFGKCNALTVETAGSPTLSVVDNSYLLASSNDIPDGFIIRTTNPLPATYKVTVDMGDIDFDLLNPSDFENGVYLPTITAVAGAPTTNDWWHSNRKVHIDVDNNIWGSGGEHPVFIGYYDPSSLTEPDPANGQLVYDNATHAWIEINTSWASAFNYAPNTWYTFEIEKTPTTYFFRIYDAFSRVLLREASIPIADVRSGDDFLAIGDPHTNYYQGSIKIANLRITNINCGGLPAISSFTADPATIPVGGSTVLSWATTGATSLSISAVGAVTGTSRTVSPAATTTYVLTATNGSGSVTAGATVAIKPVKIYLEAESAAGLFAPFRIANDSAASNGKYVYVPASSGNSFTPGKIVASYNVNIPQSGTYILWGRVIAPDANHDSFFVQIDNGPDNYWDVQNGAAWHWDQVNNQTHHVDPAKFTLTKGTHTIKIKLRENGTKLDRIFLTNDIIVTP